MRTVKYVIMFTRMVFRLHLVEMNAIAFDEHNPSSYSLTRTISATR